MRTYILQGIIYERDSSYTQEVIVVADSKEEALQKAPGEGLAIHETSVLTVEEYEAKAEQEKKEHEEFWRKIEEEKQRKKDKKLQKQMTRAEELGLSLETYIEYEKLEEGIKRAERRRRYHYGDIKRAEQGIEYENNLIAKKQAEMKKILEKK